MSYILKDQIHTVVARSIYEGILNRTVPMYFFLGRTLPWDDELNPPEATTSPEDETETRRHIVNMQRILSTELTFVIPRQEWTPKIYDMYDTAYSEDYKSDGTASKSLGETQMFVMNSEYNLYKCIFNNYGGESTVEPSGQSLEYQTYADNYVWKYVMPLSTLSRERFLSPQYMPIENAIDDSFFQTGIEPIIISGGQGYDVDNTLILVQGDGERTANLRPIIDAGTGEITNIIVDDPGLNYTLASISVVCPDPGGICGSGAVIEAELSGLGDTNLAVTQAQVELAAVDGEISCIYVTNPGSLYSSVIGETICTITGDGTGALADVVVDPDTGSVLRIDITNRGSDYTTATATITDTRTAPNNVGTEAAARTIIAPPGGHGHSIIDEAYPRTIAFYLDTVSDNVQNVDIAPDYRQSGLIVRPTIYTEGTRYKFDGDKGSPCWVVTIDQAGYELVNDTFVYRQSDGQRFNIVSTDNLATYTRFVIQVLETASIEVGDVFVDANDNVLFTVTNVLEPEIDRYSGTMLYYDNKTVYRQEEDQNIILKTYIEF
jgi:Bacteriophage T4, Gp8.